MQEGLVTVVIPVYKTEKYLDRCVSSVVNQTYRNLEILLIDDGSPDNCPQMCDVWAQKDCRIRVIHKENQGAGIARNTGIDQADGEYVLFLDSDDYIAYKAIDCAVLQAKEESADVVLFGYCVVDGLGNTTNLNNTTISKTKYHGDEVREELLPSLLAGRKGQCINTHPRACLIALEAVKSNNWRFRSERDVFSEDVFMYLELYRFINIVAIISEALYFYCFNETSITRTYRQCEYERIKRFYSECINLCKASKYSKKLERCCMTSFLSFTIAAMKQEAARSDNKRDAQKQICKIIDDDLLQAVLQEKKKDEMGLKQKILFWAMRHKKFGLCFIFLMARNKMKES